VIYGARVYPRVYEADREATDSRVADSSLKIAAELKTIEWPLAV
jgi:hypothetical protein